MSLPGVRSESNASSLASRSYVKRPWHKWVLRLGFLAIPARYRFDIALFSARLLVPLVRHTAYFRQRRQSLVDSPVDIALHLVLAGLTYFDVPFKPRLQINGFCLFEAAAKTRRGVLLISGHNVFGYAILGYLNERGYQVCLASHSPNPHKWLLPNVVTSTVPLNRSYLLNVRQRLKNGEIVGAMIDRKKKATGSRSFSVSVAGGTLYVNDAVIEVAVHAKANVIFLSALVGKDAIEIELTAPSSQNGDPKIISGEFAKFLQQHIASNRFQRRQSTSAQAG